MRKIFVLVLAATLALTMTAGVAQAKGKPAGAGKPAQKKVPTVAYVFEGTVASVDALNGTVTVEVKQANKFANAYLESQSTESQRATQVTVNVDTEGEDATKIRKDDAGATLEHIALGDEIVVNDRTTKGATSFTAGIIVANTSVVVAEPIV